MVGLSSSLQRRQRFPRLRLISDIVDAGKSTMLGVLVKGNLDDGRGKARVNLFRHKHEIESGRTSSVGMEIMGFDTHGDVVASNVPGRKLSWEEIGNRSVGGDSGSRFEEAG